MLAVFCSSLFYGLGLGPICFTLLGELLPARWKGDGTAIVVGLRSLMVGVMTKCYPWARAALGLEGVLFFCAWMAFAGVGFTYFFVPETKGKSLTELSRLFDSDQKRSRCEEGEDRNTER